MNRPDGRDDGTQSGPGEQIRPNETVPGGDANRDRDTPPLSTAGDGCLAEDDLAKREDGKKTAPAEGGDK